MMKKLAFTLITILLSLSVLIVFAELSVRLFTDITVPLTQRHVKLGNTYRANTTQIIVPPESKKEILLRINNEGFRGPTRPVRKEKNTVRIAILGDSMIASLNTKEEDTFVYYVEKKLTERYPQVTWEVFNFGVSGASTAQEFNLYREVVKKYRMDVIVCAYLNANDFSDNSRRLSWNPRIYMDIDAASGQLVTHYLKEKVRTTGWLNEYSRFYVWQKHMIKVAAKRLLTKGYAGQDRKILGKSGNLIYVNDPDDADLAYSWRLNERIIKAFHDEVARDGSRFIFLSIPDVEAMDWKWNEFRDKMRGTKYADKVERFYPENRFRSLAASHGIRHLFLREAFERHNKTTPKDDPGYYLSFVSGRGHLNETGNRLMSDEFFEYLEKEGMIAALIRAQGER